MEDKPLRKKFREVYFSNRLKQGKQAPAPFPLRQILTPHNRFLGEFDERF